MPLITPTRKLYHKGALVKRMYRAGAVVYQAPAATTAYLIDFISGATAYLYPYASRNDDPRVSSKYVQIEASSIAERVEIPSAGSQADMPQLTDGNAYGYIDLTVTRSGTSSGNLIHYHFVDSSNRWEVSFVGTSSAGLRLFERTQGTTGSAKFSGVGSVPSGGTAQIGIRSDASGHVFYLNGSEVARYSTVGSNPEEATVFMPNTSGLARSNVFLYPLRIIR